MKKIDSYEKVWKRQSAERASKTPRQPQSTSANSSSKPDTKSNRKAKSASSSKQVYSQNRTNSGREAPLPAASATLEPINAAGMIPFALVSSETMEMV